jgi:hypothetical protein
MGCLQLLTGRSSVLFCYPLLSPRVASVMFREDRACRSACSWSGGGHLVCSTKYVKRGGY